jgi:SAM-dependent methyltransferase
MTASTKSPPAEYAGQLIALIQSPAFLRATFAGPKRFDRSSSIIHATARIVELSEGRKLQIARFTAKKDLTTNCDLAQTAEALADLLAAGFANTHITLANQELDLRLSKKGQLSISKSPRAQFPAPDLHHNRAKNLPLPEGLTGGHADQLLLAMGIVDRAGRVRPTSRSKFTQINEFLKLLDHALPEVIDPAPKEQLVILDCGCGASHLTLATWHFLTRVKSISTRIIGIDQNPEVLAAAQSRAAELNAGDAIQFRAAKIGSVTDLTADIVLALHACDTATDDALAQAVKSSAKLILAVPCCHKDLNARLNIPALTPIHHHGILHQRLADIITDTARALLLKVMGYRAQVIEFISPEHTSRNLMLRAVKSHPAPDKQAITEYQAFKQTIGATPYLERILNFNLFD